MTFGTAVTNEDTAMPPIEIEETQPLARMYARSVLSSCPECNGELVVLRVIGGRAGSEYWTLRCTHCGGIHLDVLKPRAAAVEDDGPPPAA
jgi:hypothetical protein